jgi:lysophospholipase L1-like esterase
VFVVRGEGGKPVRADGSMVSDATLLWRYQRGATFNGRQVNALGFLDRDVTAQKNPGTRRVICLGDSCTAQGSPPYAGRLDQMLRDDPPDGHPWEAFNTGVHGYSVLQGLVLYRAEVSKLEPDIVTIYFGWNDHWLAHEKDGERLARAGSQTQTLLRNAIARKRLHTLLAPESKPSESDQIRVTPDEYRKGLADLMDAIRKSGAAPLVLTAPRAETIHRGIVHGGHAHSVHEAIELHDQYVAMTREVAAEQGAPVLDLAERFSGESSEQIFSKDGIHLTDAGLQRVAESIHAELKEMAGSL